MVADRLLDLRLPDFSRPSPRALSTKATPPTTGVFLDPPMKDYMDEPLGNYVQMGSASALLTYAIVTTGGRVVQAIYNRATRRPQLLYTESGELIDFPTDQVVQPQHNHDHDDKPTTPRPATTTTIAFEDEARPQRQQLDGGQTANTTSQSTDTPIAALFQETNDEHDWTLQMTDEHTRLDIEKMGRGKWAERTPEDAVKENILLRKIIQYYEDQANTKEITKDNKTIAIT